MSSEHLTPDELLKRAYSLSNDAEAQSLYQDWAETYDETMLEGLAYATPRKTAAMLSKKMPDGTCRILDVGSGTGLAGQNLAEQGFSNIDALDYSTAMLAVAQRRQCEGSKVYNLVIEADLNQPLDIRDEVYDAMICTGTFTHAHVGADALDELFRVLKPGGLFACTVHQDIWVPQGFDKKTKELAEAGILRTLGMTMGTYYDTEEEPEGWYILWEKCA